MEDDERELRPGKTLPSPLSAVHQGIGSPERHRRRAVHASVHRHWCRRYGLGGTRGTFRGGSLSTMSAAADRDPRGYTSSTTAVYGSGGHQSPLVCSTIHLPMATSRRSRHTRRQADATAALRASTQRAPQDQATIHPHPASWPWSCAPIIGWTPRDLQRSHVRQAPLRGACSCTAAVHWPRRVITCNLGGAATPSARSIQHTAVGGSAVAPSRPSITVPVWDWRRDAISQRELNCAAAGSVGSEST